MKQILDAAAKEEPVLLEESTPLTRSLQLDRLASAFNRLIEEQARIKGTGRGYSEQIQALLGRLREAVVMVSSDNVILSANPAFLELVGSHADPTGKRLDAFLQGSAFLEFLRDMRQGDAGQRREIEIQLQKNTCWLEVSAAPLQDKARKSENYTLFVFHDITRQKRLEKMRTEFVANVSHELRTPVTVIKGFAETLIEDDAHLGREERMRFLDKISRNSERLHSLLQDLLLLSRLESTELVLHKEEIRLEELLEEICEGWKPVVEQDGRRLLLELDPAAEIIYADPLRLSQVINNLVENAHRHARGYSEIRILGKAAEGGVRLTVMDNGSGIPEADLPLVFQRFYRVDKGRSRESGGTGLGLSIVKHIVAQHGGEIEPYSRRGEGTRIEIFLPDRTDPPTPGPQSGTGIG